MEPKYHFCLAGNFFLNCCFLNNSKTIASTVKSYVYFERTLSKFYIKKKKNVTFGFSFDEKLLIKAQKSVKKSEILHIFMILHAISQEEDEVRGKLFFEYVLLYVCCK